MKIIRLNEEIFDKFIKNNLLIYYMNEWKLILIKKENYKKYIQNHITFDIYSINKNKFKLCGNSNFNGKINAIIYFFYHKDKLFYIIKSSIYKNYLSKIKKYDIFCKINFNVKHNYKMIGIFGLLSYEFLKENFGFFENIFGRVFYINNISIINIGNKNNRFILISSNIIIDNFIKNKIYLNNKYKIKIIDNKYWILLDILDEYPIINKKNINRFFPQELNLLKFNSISFDKGCYIGQEIISKINFLKLQKRSLYNFYGNFDIFPKIGNFLKIKINNEYKNAGIILEYIIFNRKTIYVQSIIYNKFINFKNFKIKNSNYYLSILK